MKRLDWLGGLVLAPLAIFAVARIVAHDALLPFVWANGVTAWLYLPAWIVLAVAIFKKRGALAVASTLLVLCHLAWVAPSLISTNETPQGARLRVVTANLLAVNERPAALARELADTNADVIVLEEVSSRWIPELAPLVERYPHRDLLVRDDAFGIAIFSRRPLLYSEMVDLYGVPMIDATIDAGARGVRILGVHTLPPVNPEYAAIWRAQLASIAERVEASETPTILLGDLNATSHAAGFVRLERAGLRDAHDTLGRGLATTWPNGLFPLPSLRLDHVLVSEHITPIAVREGRGAGSDHRPVIVDVAVAGTSDDDQRRHNITNQPAHASEIADHTSGDHGLSTIAGAIHAQIAGEAS
jgi:endonuclease/exonuclease/phosphatase (EEP) superfamily protein YafD